MKKTGKLIQLIHNPTAGEGDYSRKRITALMRSHGYRCSYSSSKKRILKSVPPETEFIVIAGGDGTIRKAIMRLLNKKLKYKRPIALLPFGTANNIATSLNIPQDNAKNISSWSGYHLKKFDVGQVVGLPETAFFIESFGFGLFPKLMKVLKKMDTDHIQNAEEEFKLAIHTLMDLTRNYKGVPFKMEIDGRVIEDRAILIEVMNISSLGPHLRLSKTANPEDGLFDVVIITESQRQKLLDYLEGKSANKEPSFSIKPMLTKNLRIKWHGKDVHADDQVIKVYEQPNLDISLLDSLLEMVTPAEEA